MIVNLIEYRWSKVRIRQINVARRNIILRGPQRRDYLIHLLDIPSEA